MSTIALVAACVFLFCVELYALRSCVANRLDRIIELLDGGRDEP